MTTEAARPVDAADAALSRWLAEHPVKSLDPRHRRIIDRDIEPGGRSLIDDTDPGSRMADREAARVYGGRDVD